MANREKKRGGGKYKNLDISRTKIVFLMKEKAFCIVFKGLSISVKIKIDKK